MTRPAVVIIGGGLAGLATAWALSEFPLDVTVLESRRRTGGRAGSFYDEPTRQEIDYCQHVAMGCCTNFVWLMQQSGLIDQFSRERALTFFTPGLPAATLQPHAWLPAPLHLAGALGQLHFLQARQKSEIRRGMWRLLRSASTLPQQTMGEWLAAAGQSAETIRQFWDVVLVSALGEQTQHVAYAPARKVLIDGFLASRQAADLLIPRRPLADLFGSRLAGELQRRGVRIECDTAARGLQFDGQRLTGVQTPQQTVAAQQAVLAVPWYALPRLVEHTPAARAIPDLNHVADFPMSPISGVHLWFDRAITKRRHSVLIGGVAQWLFRPEHASGEDASAEHYYQVVVSASGDLRGQPADRIVASIVAELRMHFPDARGATLLRSRCVTDPRAVFSVRPDVEPYRPSQQTLHRQLHLAGDYTRTGWPATMEGAVISGFAAADGVLRAAGLGRFALQAPLRRGWLARRLIKSDHGRSKVEAR